MAPRKTTTSRKRANNTAPSAHTRRAISVTTMAYKPPDNPPARELGGRWRRVLQGVASYSDKNAHNVSTKSFFDNQFNTNGFDRFLLHRVVVWSDDMDQATAEHRISAALTDKSGIKVGPTYRDSASQSDRRASVGFHVPAHLSGPFPGGDGAYFVQLEGAKNYVVEIDATFF